MTRLGPIDFDDGILDALRDDRLVVFAGAGVSMGDPSKLPSFATLAKVIAAGTGHEVTEPFDRFLGELHHKGVRVHDRAAEALNLPGSAPTTLHRDLLRLFRAVERVRLVTTNFDYHFETAAEDLFGRLPEVYRAPALPLGRSFRGIVYVHGSLRHHNEIVLTDADFGRGYLTEGWARRFLLEVFRTYTVLFVGYSHDDVVMNYLARALPAERVASRYALTERDGNWELLGIRPLRFTKGAGVDPYKELYDGVRQLADRATRGALDWQSRLAEIGSRLPPADEEAIGEVEQALQDVHTTRFLTSVARGSEWPKWLDDRKHLDALFDFSGLSERDRLLARWLAENFSIPHPDVMFDLIAAHGMRLNSVLWWFIGRELGLTEKVIDESALKRWVTILIAYAPPQADHHIFTWLAERCAIQGAVQATMTVFLAMTKHRLTIKPGFVWQDQKGGEHGRRLDADYPLRADHWSLNEVWIKHLKPHLSIIAQPVLSGICRRFEEIHRDVMAWDQAAYDWDPISSGRSAIEPHDQDRYPDSIDVLIDAARDTLEWLANGSMVLFEAWIESLVQSEVPILRRLSVHAVCVHPAMSADERLNWLLSRVGLHGFAEHHEVHRLVALAYPVADLKVQQAVLDAILSHAGPAWGDWSEEKTTARSHFRWLSWLLQAKPDCPLAEGALEPIKAKYPEWRPSEHLDFTHWTSSATWKGHEGPWSVDQLLATEPRKQIDELSMFEGGHFDGPDRDGLITAVKNACKQRVAWGLALAEVLVERSLWSSDLWHAVFRGWQEADLAVDEWRTVLKIIASPELHEQQGYEVARLLYSSVREGGKPFDLDLLEQADSVAFSVWLSLGVDELDEDTDDWLSRAINRPAGVIVEFWLNGLSLLMRDKSGQDRILPDNYRQWFTLVVQDQSSKGGLGRSLLASQTAFLFGLDEAWTRQYIVPLFSDTDRRRFTQAWDGFLVWGRLFPVLVDVLLPAFISAIARIGADFPDRHRRFVEFYTALSVFHVADPTRDLLPAFFQHGSTEDRIGFASHLGYFLRQMEPPVKKELWDRWLRSYWRDRQQAVPAVLDESEIRNMLEWLPHLDDAFPEAVLLAVRSSTVQLERSHLLWELRQSDLIFRYPTQTAELLIYLCSCELGYHAAEVGRVAERLPPLAPELRLRLDEALARAGAR